MVITVISRLKSVRAGAEKLLRLQQETELNLDSLIYYSSPSETLQERNVLHIAVDAAFFVPMVNIFLIK